MQLLSENQLTLRRQSDQQQKNWTRTSTEDQIEKVNWDWDGKGRKEETRERFWRWGEFILPLARTVDGELAVWGIYQVEPVPALAQTAKRGCRKEPALRTCPGK